MKKWMFAVVFVALTACSDDETKPNNEANPCGSGEAVRVDGALACVYGKALIEEGFTCPALVPRGFNLVGGAVACVEGNRMPEPLQDQLETLGYTPNDPECFGETPAQTCYYNPPVPQGAFDLTNADVIEYKTTATDSYCVETGQVLDFRFDLANNSLSFGLGREGQTGSTTCVTDSPTCIERADFLVALTQVQVDDLLGLVAAIPAPNCVAVPGLSCGPACINESLSVGTQTISPACCGENTAGYYEAFKAVIAYVKALEPQVLPAFDNSTTFQILTYSARPASVVCIDADNLLGSTITRQADGSLAAEGTFAVLGDAATDTCIVDPSDGKCWVSTPYGPTTLTPAAQTELEARLAALPAPMCTEEPGLMCSAPCVVNLLKVDQVAVNRECCGSTVSGFTTAFDQVVESIEAAR